MHNCRGNGCRGPGYIRASCEALLVRGVFAIIPNARSGAAAAVATHNINWRRVRRQESGVSTSICQGYPFGIQGNVQRPGGWRSLQIADG